MADYLDGFNIWLSDVLLLLACITIAAAAALALAWVIVSILEWVDRP